MTTKAARQAALARRFGTDRPLPRVRTMPGTCDKGNVKALGLEVFVGETKHGNKPTRTQLDKVSPDPKRRPIDVSEVSALSCSTSSNQHDVSGSISSHKRRPDTIDFDAPPLKVARADLQPGSILGRRFPHLVKRVTTADAESNKRRRILPFKTEGRGDGQCTDPGFLI